MFFWLGEASFFSKLNFLQALGFPQCIPSKGTFSIFSLFLPLFFSSFKCHTWMAAFLLFKTGLAVRKEKKRGETGVSLFETIFTFFFSQLQLLCCCVGSDFLCEIVMLETLFLSIRIRFRERVVWAVFLFRHGIWLLLLSISKPSPFKKGPGERGGQFKNDFANNRYFPFRFPSILDFFPFTCLNSFPTCHVKRNSVYHAYPLFRPPKTASGEKKPFYWKLAGRMTI